jgi:iron complex transport system substrate-binding protein
MSLCRSFGLFATVLLLGCGSAPAIEPEANKSKGAPPQRIVSMNPCVDAILVEIADHRTIASISHYSQMAEASSIPLTLAARFPANDGTAEAVIAAEPDLVISGPHVSLATIGALERLGIPLLQTPVPDSIAASKAQIADMASRIGRESQGKTLIARIDHAVDGVRTPGQINAIIRQGGGLVPGKGTLADEMLTLAGYRNMSVDYGLEQWDVLPIEPVLASPPTVLFATNGEDGGGVSAIHPAIAKARTDIRLEDFPPALLHCGGPTIIAALDRLKEAR